MTVRPHEVDTKKRALTTVIKGVPTGIPIADKEAARPEPVRMVEAPAVKAQTV